MDFKIFPRPKYDRAIFSLMPTILSHNLKVDIPDPHSEFIFKSKSILRHFEESDITIIVIIDALGVYQLRGKIYELWKEQGSIVLSSIFPTLTAPAILSIYAGLPPELHGIISQKMYIPEIGNFVDTLRCRVLGAPRKLRDAGVNVESFLWEKPILAYVPEDVLVIEMLPYVLVREGGLRDFYAKYVESMPYELDIDLMYKIGAMLDYFIKKRRRALITLYISYPDAIGHEIGTGTQNWGELIDRIYSIAKKIIDITNDKSSIRIATYFVSDHGLMPIKHIVEISQEKAEIFAKTYDIRVFAKSGRFAFIYTTTELDRSEVEALFENKVIVVPTENILDYFWPRFNESKEKILLRCGKYTVLYKDFVESIIQRPDEDTSELSELKKNLLLLGASHGGASQQELSSIFISHKNF